MFQRNLSNGDSRSRRVQYVVADPLDVQGVSNHYDFADNPCQTGTEEECAEWLNQRLTEAYND